MKTLVIGDIHGCLTELKALIEKAGQVDEIISVGDIIDRGPDSYGVIKFCQSNNIKVCLGNHELMAIHALNDYLGPDHPFKRMGLLSSDWFQNGGSKAFDSIPEEELPEILSYLKSLPLFYLTSHNHQGLQVVISHSLATRAISDFSKELYWDSPLTDAVVWNRQLPMSSPYFNIHGHTPTDFWREDSPPVPMTSNYHMDIDTGCCYSTKTRGVLTGVILPDMKVVQVVKS